MFTGIITHLGKFLKNKDNNLAFAADKSICNKLHPGSSISINGICLTVNKKPSEKSFSVTAMPETFKRTTLSILQENDLVNLELPVTPQNFLAGHFVQGHVDGVGTVVEIKSEGNSKILKIKITSDLSNYIAEKGSIAVNGISLTVIESVKNYFTVGIITHTWANTNLRQIKIGDGVNIETDIIAKYVENQILKIKNQSASWRTKIKNK